MNGSNAESFFDDYARLYDAIYAGQDFDDVEFYVERARAADGPVLEVGCGTGRVYLELLRAGVDADGIDLSREMLDVLGEKADEAGLDASVWRADMTDFESPREYALVIVPFRSFLHNVTVEDQLAALECFREALRPDGELVLNAFAPDFDYICGKYGQPQEDRVTVGDRPFHEETVSEFEDELEQVISMQRMVYPAGSGAAHDDPGAAGSDAGGDPGTAGSDAGGDPGTAGSDAGGDPGTAGSDAEGDADVAGAGTGTPGSDPGAADADPAPGTDGPDAASAPTVEAGDVPALLVNEVRLALVSKREFELLFRLAGYDDWEVYGGFDLDPLESTDQEMVWVARP